MAYTDPNAQPYDEALWNPLLGQWMDPSGNPAQGQGGNDAVDPLAFAYDEATNTATGRPTTDEEWDIANQARYDQGQFYDPANATGGYLDGVGITLGEGTSETQAGAQAAIEAARAAGVPEDFISDFLGRNGLQDASRLISAYGGGQSGGGGGGVSLRSPGGIGGSASSSASGNPYDDEIMAALRGMFDPAMNQQIVDRRTELARENLERERKSRRETNRAELASRGLLGMGEGYESGPEATEIFEREEDLADLYRQAVSGIFADESERADDRSLRALQVAADLGSEEARNALDWFRATTERELGFGQLDLDEMLGTGNLALGNLGLVNDYNLGLGQLGLDRDRLIYEIEQGNIDNALRLIEELTRNADTAAGGFLGD